MLKTASVVLIVLLLVVFALMGLLYSTRGTPARAVHSFGDPTGPPAIEDSTFLQSIELLTNTRVRRGHRVELLYNGDGTYPRLFEDLRRARRSITLHLYYWQPGKVADSLKTILSERAKAGVSVLLLMDAFGAQPMGSAYIDSLEAARVRVAEYRPLRWYTLHKAQNRSHMRLVVIDDSIGYTGGFGIADQWLGDGLHGEGWRETNVRFTGPAVAQMQATFAITWVEATGQLFTASRNFFGATADASMTGQMAGLLYAVPTIGSTPAERYLALSIAGARKRLYITNSYFVPDDDLRRLLIEAAGRGVDVRILTAAKNTDIKMVRWASHAQYEELLAGGIRIYEYQPVMMHSKVLVVDGLWSTVGTLNIDNRSLAFNDESNLLVYDSAFGAAMEQQFFRDLRYSREFKLDLFRRRSWFSRLLETAASRIAKLL